MHSQGNVLRWKSARQPKTQVLGDVKGNRHGEGKPQSETYRLYWPNKCQGKKVAPHSIALLKRGEPFRKNAIQNQGKAALERTRQSTHGRQGKTCEGGNQDQTLKKGRGGDVISDSMGSAVGECPSGKKGRNESTDLMKSMSPH